MQAQPADEGTTVVPVEETPVQAQPEEEGGVVVPIEEESAPNQEEDLIYFESEENNQQPANGNNTDNKQNGYELEDEYYDLDGF